MKTIFSGYAFDASQSPPVYCAQELRVSETHLEHTVDGVKRAEVGIDNAAAYVCEGWVGDIGNDKKFKDLAALRKTYSPPDA